MPDWIQLPAFKEDFKKSGKPDYQFADELKVSVFTVRNWLTGSKVPGDKRKRKIAENLGVDPHRYIDMPLPGQAGLSEVARFQIDQARETLSDPRFTDHDRQELVDELKRKATWMLSVKGSPHG